MNRFCDACGSTKPNLISVGSALLCRKCEAAVMAIVNEKRESGENRVSVLAEARKIFREQYSGGDVIIKDFPADLKAATKTAADKAGMSMREYILQCIKKSGV